ncbi:GNAT family N-acetyltransferase [uncultured Thiothrix sp.]|uniref:GNAT family N-acetyltransferase n=1 Tax=uncultured Thiothrix sp. TaxID=223185 RepID=UPI002623E936|nr:GNAT family N-acetyltransferase [uncultured Thiothrix sp.]
MIRPYQRKDLAVLSEVYQRARPYELGFETNQFVFSNLLDEPDNLKRFLQSTIFVLEEDGVLKGFGGYVHDYIAWLYVDPRYHRQKVGLRLLKHMLEKLKNRKQLRISIVKSNLAARACYKGLGFREQETFSFSFQGKTLEGLRMTREL